MAVLFGLVLVAGQPIENLSAAGVAYASVAVGSGLVLLAAAWVAQGRSRVAWSLIGAGALCWGLGEAVWIIQAQVGEIPYPGIADFFYVAGYPLIFVGVILHPYLRPGRFERIRLAIDATAGALSLAVVMWVAYLHTVVELGTNSVETFLNVTYPLGDVLLVTALMILAMRRSETRLDLRIILLAGGVALTAAADLIFAVQVAADTYVEWGRLDGVWLFSYGLFALAAWVVTKPAASRAASYSSLTTWQLVAPYSAVAALFLLRFTTSTGSDLLLNLTTTAVAVLVVVRQNLAIREKRELLERQRDDLIASVSHELRTPLTGIQGYAQLLAESWDDLETGERTEMLGTINAQANHLGHIVTDLIDVARDRLQSVNLTLIDYGAADIVKEAVATAGGGRSIRIEADPEARIWAEPDRIRQVLVNLITNAIRYGGSEILVTAARNGQLVEFAVHDDGEGVPTKFQAEMWGRFERGFHKGDMSVPGSGIGLSVARDLVAAHGGTIGYRTSELLGGACFAFSIPVPGPGSLDLVSAQAERVG
ncbi:MAG TPA: HAMP domain-containing sensor histidine kinase [Acidimicrobiia bacterium]|nr:HAMP domain-containing sensor histidine kinase [Acidimicrobiia bacterium]